MSEGNPAELKSNVGSLSLFQNPGAVGALVFGNFQQCSKAAPAVKYINISAWKCTFTQNGINEDYP